MRGASRQVLRGGAITGNLREFGRFDVPTLFGIRDTAPDFHDNSARTLEDVVRHYQALFELLAFFAGDGLFAPPENGQGCFGAECGIRPLPDDEVAGLLAYVTRALIVEGRSDSGGLHSTSRRR